MGGRPATQSHDAVDILSVLPRRLPVVELIESEAASKRDLVERLDVSRTTVDRAMRDLESLGLVDYDDGKYGLTPVGEVVAVETRGLLERFTLAQWLEPFLRWMPIKEFNLDLRLLADADLLLPESGDPYSMINRHVQMLEEMDHCLALLPVTGLHATEAATGSIVDDGATGVVVAESQVARKFRTDPQYRELVEDAVETGRMDLYEHDGPIPYGLCLIDETVQIVADEEGDPRALLETDAAAVRKWAEQTFEEYRSQATRIELESSEVRSGTSG